MLFLSDRDIIEISEFEDFNQIENFLQSIISNDIKLIKDFENNSIYTLFLNSQGRFLFDCFLIIQRKFKKEKIFLDCHKNFSEKIILHLKKYKVRLSFLIQKRNDLFVFSNIDEFLKFDKLLNFDDLLFEFKDDRSQNKEMGKRFVFQKKNLQDLSNHENDLSKYQKIRIENGIFDCAFDLESEISLPINYKMHSQNAISLQKGCYIGQETTNRLFRTSIVRKEIFSIKLNNQFEEEIQKNDLIFWKNSKNEFEKIGNFISFYKEFNMAFCFFEKPQADLQCFESNSEKKDFLQEMFTKNSIKTLFFQTNFSNYKIFYFEIIKIII